MDGYQVGDYVSYGLHGKCQITAIESREMAEGTTRFYLLRAIKNPIAAKTAATKADPLIWIPIDAAQATGMRSIMSKEDAEAALRMLAEPDYHFEVDQTWVAKQKLLEGVIRKEGAIGLVKVVGHMHVLTIQDALPPSPIVRFSESVQKLLVRELSEVLNQPSKDVEILVQRALRNKTKNDN